MLSLSPAAHDERYNETFSVEMDILHDCVTAKIIFQASLPPLPLPHFPPPPPRCRPPFHTVRCMPRCALCSALRVPLANRLSAIITTRLVPS